MLVICAPPLGRRRAHTQTQMESIHQRRKEHDGKTWLWSEESRKTSRKANSSLTDRRRGGAKRKKVSPPQFFLSLNLATVSCWSPSAQKKEESDQVWEGSHSLSCDFPTQSINNKWIGMEFSTVAMCYTPHSQCPSLPEGHPLELLK